MTSSRPVVLKPEPQRGRRIFTPAARARLESTFDVIDLEGVDDASTIDRALLAAFAVAGQPDLDTDRLVRAQHLRAMDVWPEEPVSRSVPARKLDGLVMSPHRPGGIPQAFFEIGDMVCDDLELIAQGLTPDRLQVAAPELVDRYRNRPVGERP